MADTRLVADYPPLKRHRDELREQRRLRRRRLMIAVPIGVLTVVAAATLSAPLAMMLAGVAALAIFFAALPGSSSVDAGQLAGVEGEAAVLERLKQLPDDFAILNRVRLPDETLTNGERELDFIIAGPTGLWVVEVKNTPGHVQVRPGEKHWPLARRAGCGSQPSWNAMPNPVPQARAGRGTRAVAAQEWRQRPGTGHHCPGASGSRHYRRRCGRNAGTGA
ncbi:MULTISPECIES: nuclease-related domain-containing protein [unclassified Wenzhouxiangella]|uniref:nuclease-related domain-containing protein n=1 Tax=unclassified Wenzhouxiangella TaxID=2613841 RepID=UPI000E32CDF5|nr:MULTISPECIES: nuclease-related domain-containing protein [unclassified Wenzhouxiangella]RFF27008.1 NERD domain-containing protein [Wenzhouxiangella sp. 15181]RFP69519.1 NERD domain-containing protein [Wenzhouxiangella sp. 15190]